MKKAIRFYQFVVQWNAGEPYVTPDWDQIGLPCPEYGREGECYQQTGHLGYLVMDQAYVMVVDMAVRHRHAMWKVLMRTTGSFTVEDIGEVSIHHTQPFPDLYPAPCPHRRRRTDKIDS